MRKVTHGTAIPAGPDQTLRPPRARRAHPTSPALYRSAHQLLVTVVARGLAFGCLSDTVSRPSSDPRCTENSRLAF